MMNRIEWMSFVKEESFPEDLVTKVKVSINLNVTTFEIFNKDQNVQ
jgi:hypothetical protein